MQLLDDNLEPTFDTEELAVWLAFDQMKTGFGLKRVQILNEYFGSLKAVWTASDSELRAVRGVPRDAIEGLLSKRKEIEPEKLYEKLVESDVSAYPYLHPLYPYRLREIHDPPLILYMRGSLHPDDLRNAIGVVGTRKPTNYGRRLAKQFARELAVHGVTIVSGMAIGVDSLAHWGALDAKGRTVAVLACGPDICYPSSNRPLYSQIVDHAHGAVVSEFAPSVKPESWHFPARNRIISGLCDATLVIEAGDTSGALITARLAFEQNRAAFAIPGSIDNPMSIGTNRLIGNHQAQLVTNVADILKHLNWVSSPQSRDLPSVVELFGREREVYELLSAEPMHFDHLCAKTGMQAGELSGTLTMLELAGVVTRHPGEWYTREPETFLGK